MSLHTAQRTEMRHGFTLVELLVVIAIIGILVTLLLPAVQQAREAARRSQCQNHLKQLALAAHNFHDVHGRFPPGYLAQWNAAAADDWNHQFVGSTVYLLPYMEQQVVYDRMDLELNVDRVDRPYWTKAATWATVQTRLPTLLCPSATPYSNRVGTIAVLETHITPNMPGGGTLEMYYFPLGGGGNEMGRSNYIACTGAMGNIDNGWRRYRGIFSLRSKNRFSSILDGTSHTLLIGEAIGGGDNDNGEHMFSHSWVGSGVMSVLWGLKGRGNWYQYSSRHPGIVQFAFADGSVRRILNEVEVVQIVFAGGMDERGLLRTDKIQ